MKYITVHAILSVVTTQAVAGFAVIGQSPSLGPRPVVRTTGESDNNPIWNSKGLAMSSNVQLRVVNNFTTSSNISSNASSADMGPMGSKDYRCGLFTGQEYVQKMSRVQLAYSQAASLLHQRSAIPASNSTNGTMAFPAPFAPGLIARTAPIGTPSECSYRNASLLMFPIKKTPNSSDKTQDQQSVFRPRDPAGRHRLIVAYNAGASRTTACGVVFFRSSSIPNGAPMWCEPQQPMSSRSIRYRRFG